MKLTLLQISKQVVFSQNIQIPLHVIHASLAWFLSVDKNVIQIHNDKNIKFFCQDLIDVFLEAYSDIG